MGSGRQRKDTVPPRYATPSRDDVMSAARRLVLDAERRLHQRGRRWRPDAAWERSREGILAVMRTLERMEAHARDLRWRLAERHLEAGDVTVTEVAEAFGISRQAVDQRLKRRDVPPGDCEDSRRSRTASVDGATAR